MGVAESLYDLSDSKVHKEAIGQRLWSMGEDTVELMKRFLYASMAIAATAR